MLLRLKLLPSTGLFFLIRAARSFTDENIATATTTTSPAPPFIMPGTDFYFPFMVGYYVK
ncbi:hypothetical protein [Paraburkholderia lacunae]|uniref:Uncharacterized protein n=1 Tax=Paraburkholderia lacunae TaxID=2211104 RepID=A0A370N259_9BURK|nr:hypothetical protein [Paraburkholderia lacunae]RDJ99713.1 hypothetical protein DLM46_26455 [Paraburkholderia lacunae]